PHESGNFPERKRISFGNLFEVEYNPDFVWRRLFHACRMAQSSAKMPACGEGSLAVLSHVHRAPYRIAVGHAVEYIADAGPLITVDALAAQTGPLDRPFDVSRQKLAAMAALQLAAILLEE